MATTTLNLHRPPHAVPKTRTRTLPRTRPRTVQGRLGLAAAALFALLGLASITGCGRTELLGTNLAGDAEMDIELSRELELQDSRIVLVELLAPALPAARTNLVAAQDGLSLDELLAEICPDGEPEVIFDTTDVPVLEVYMDGELRALIY